MHRSSVLIYGKIGIRYMEGAMESGGVNRILCIEDDPDIQAVLRLSLESVGGFEVRVIGSGFEAVAAAMEFTPDLILLDVMMPGMDGPVTLAKLRSETSLRRVPVVFMTAKIQPGEIDGYRRMDILDVIPKPFDPMTLPATIAEILGRGNVRT